MNLDELQALCDEAPQGPWRACQLKGFGPMRFVISDADKHYSVVAILENSGSFKGDEFIAECRSAVPELIARVREAESKVAELEEENSRLNGRIVEQQHGRRETESYFLKERDAFAAQLERVNTCPVCGKHDPDGLEACSKCYNAHFASTAQLERAREIVIEDQIWLVESVRKIRSRFTAILNEAKP